MERFIKRVPIDSIIVHSKWESVPDGYDNISIHFEDYVVEAIYLEEETEDWNREIREFIENDSKTFWNRYTEWEKITIWYELPTGKEIYI